jgi:hypothetical protein
MRATFTALLLAAIGCASPAPPEKPSESDAEAPVFVDDFIRLRTEYGEKEDFFALCEDDRPLRAMGEAFNAERWQAALDVALPWLAHCPVDIDARMVAAVALLELGRPQEADLHKRWYHGLVDSVLASGDGKSVETAFVVISVPEEYAMLRALGLRFAGEQALLGDGIDALGIEGESGKSTVYFDPAAHFRRLARELAK